MTDTELELPQGWVEITVNEITRIIDYRGRTPPYVEKGGVTSKEYIDNYYSKFL